MAITRRIIPRVYNGTDHDTVEFQTVANAVKTATGSAEPDMQAHADSTARHITPAERTNWNAKQSATPDGTTPLISDNKISSVYLPDALVGQVIYGGTINTSGVATLSDAFRTAFDVSSSTLQILAVDASKYPGAYFIASDAAAFTNQIIIGVSGVSTGDWLISNGASGWAKVDNTDAVASVNGKTGAVVLAKGDVGLGNVDNTSDANKPISTAQLTALNSKASAADLANEIARATAAENNKLDKTAQAADSAKLGGKLPTEYATAAQGAKADTALQAVPDATTVNKGIVLLGASGGAARYGQKADVGLSAADNTSDINKPVSTAQATAINARAKITVSPTQPVGAVTGDFWYQVV